MKNRPLHLHILPGNAAYNRGDRGNLEAQIRLLREGFPGARITVASFRPEIDAGWYDAEVIPRNWLLTHAHWRALRDADLVIWGGGALVADNACRTLLPMWTVLLFLIRIVLRKRVMAWAHGVVLETGLGHWLAKRLFAWTDSITVRDATSLELVRSLGVTKPLRQTADPAITVQPSPRESGERLLRAQGVKLDGRPLFAISLTYWPFYHSSRDLLPFAQARQLGVRRLREGDRFQRHQRNWRRFIDNLLEEHDARVVLLPRYPCEPWQDRRYLRALAGGSRDAQRVHVYDDDTATPRDYLSIFRCFDLHIGTCLHDSIFAAAVGTRGVIFPYETKCRDFFLEIGAPERMLDWEVCFHDEGLDKMTALVRSTRAQTSERDLEIALQVRRLQELACENVQVLAGLLA